MISTLVIEDNPIIQEQLATTLENLDIRLIGLVKTSQEVKQIFLKEVPDLIFCDIKLPSDDGLIMMQQIKLKYPTIGIVFITGYTEFAYKAYDIEAIDYLIKPFTQERFYNCMKKVYSYVGKDKRRKERILDNILSIKVNSGIQIFNQHDIVYISAEGKNSKLILVIDNKKYIIETTESLKSIEPRLDPAIFVRTHRSFIINLNHINRIEPSGQTNLIFFKDCSDIAYLSKNHLLTMYKKLNFK
ncbi:MULTISPECIES: LytR/AlgR family response regulator transcription factor [Priestia]|uniref:LytR/AlgR family response regulator transcription factor n=1 Tax=Priestia TaxID=2800373 RepID=UPI00196AD584|nr:MULTISPECIES: LytTR family DNA-binding domain-containing protein [Priestia]MCE4093087.1 LytTR family DNA-binding domain-containing protein [Priestia megaterium]MED3821535.1 LytTR family DNA-binding domain-containing protein [Priestia aryabhattai]QSF42330.1 response regulator transcription factor [Priestia megaterium]